MKLERLSRDLGGVADGKTKGEVESKVGSNVGSGGLMTAKQMRARDAKLKAMESQKIVN